MKYIDNAVVYSENNITIVDYNKVQCPSISGIKTKHCFIVYLNAQYDGLIRTLKTQQSYYKIKNAYLKYGAIHCWQAQGKTKKDMSSENNILIFTEIEQAKRFVEEYVKQILLIKYITEGK